MKKYFLTLLLCAALFSSVAPFAHAQQGQNLPYTPLEPIPGVTQTTNGGQLDFPTLLNNIFTVMITVGALLAVLMLTVGGIEYMIAESIGKKAQGLSRAKSALWGILLVAGAWLILHTVNPQLLNFTLITCPSGQNCNVTAPPANTSGNSTNGSGSAGNSSTPTNVTVSLVDTYSAQSSFGQQISSTAQNGASLLNTANGVAVMVTNNDNLTNPTVVSEVNSFTQDCQNVGGSIQKTGATSQTIFMCVQ